MSKKYLFGLLVLSLILASFVGFVYAKGSDANIKAVFLDITFPDNANYSYNINYFNWTYSGFTPTTCFYTLNGNVEVFDCSLGTVNIASQEGSNILTVKANNSVPQSAEDTVNFWQDSLIPQISIIYPTNGTYYGDVVTQLNYNVIEANIDSCWYSVDGSPNTIASCNNGANTIALTSNEDWNTWQVCVNDSVGHVNCSEVTFFVDSIPPAISFEPETTQTGNYSQTDITIKVTCSDTNKQDIMLNWNEVNESFDNEAGNTYWETKTPGDGTYTFYAWCNDTLGHLSSTETRIVTLDTIAPVITLNAPDNSKAFAQGSDVTIDFNVVESSLKQCILNLNGNLQEVTPTTEVLSGLTSGKYEWNITCMDYSGNSAVSETRTFTVLSDLTFPPGTEYPDLTLEPNISSVWFYVKNEFGIINWIQPLDLSRGLNWADFINLSFNHANVSTLEAYELNKPATITFFNLSWTTPQILKNGAVCSDCAMKSYENGTIIFDVSGFSIYETKEKPGSVSGSSGTSCRTNQWICSNWSECLKGMQTRTCKLEKPWCENKTAKPAETQECAMQIVENKTPEIIEQVSEAPKIEGKKSRLSGITGLITANMAPTALTIGTILAITLGYLIINYRNKRLDAKIKEEISKQSGVKWVSKQEN